MLAYFCLFGLLASEMVYHEAIVQSEIQKLQGEWMVVAWDFAGQGQMLPVDRLGWLVGRETWTIRGNRLTLRHKPSFTERLTSDRTGTTEIELSETIGGETRRKVIKAGSPENSFRVDPTKEPKQMDAVFDRFSAPLPAIYRLDKDALIIAIPLDGFMDDRKPVRPTRFVADMDYPGSYILKLRRN
jgi:uncharacterized protein (TIGR03067 family)